MFHETRYLDRLYNWKFGQASTEATKDGCPDVTRRLTYLLSQQFGDCGWQEGKAFELAKELSDCCAVSLGFTFDSEQDTWVKLDFGGS